MWDRIQCCGKISDLNYEIQKSKKDKPIKVHVDKLKLCSEPETVNPRETCNVNCSCCLQGATMEPNINEERPFACNR